MKSDEHMCLSAAQFAHTNNEWNVQLKECAGYENEFWDYNRQHRKSGLCLTQRQPEMEKQDNLSPPTLATCARGHDDQVGIPFHQSWDKCDKCVAIFQRHCNPEKLRFVKIIM
ncbi:unnamed protein product [Heligmosomoides polygyrus]|uniref:Ricin B-type lectin domain-containing protein n=1 Tax=Heligmosomoides polygyrus TaxID=6339 RepID=A0A3P8CN63_HELPZ|nr:unnamed protein product [Heligmosomoides polygyrus]